MKIISWNVAGFRAVVRNGFEIFLADANPDIICLQETKMFPEQCPISLGGYHAYWNPAVKPGYSGTAILSKVEPRSVKYDVLDDSCIGEGRVLTLEFKHYYLVTVYTPNAKAELARLDYRIVWEKHFRDYLVRLEKLNPVIVCGDLNVSYLPSDVYRRNLPDNVAGFSKDERAAFAILLSCGFRDAYRELYPNERDTFSYWSYMGTARNSNHGWRLDYFLLSDVLISDVIDVKYLRSVYGSDHCPVELTIEDMT